MADTYNQTIMEVAKAVVEKAKANPMTPNEIESFALASIRNDCLMYNSIAQTGAKWKIPTTMPNEMISYIMIHLHTVRLIDTRTDDTERTKMLLGIYQNDGPDKGIYTTNESDINSIARQYNTALNNNDIKEISRILHEEAPLVQRCEKESLIAVGNGIFDYDTKQLMPFTPDLVFTSKSEIDYNTNATNVVIHNDEDGTDWDVESWVLDLMDDDKEMAELIWKVIGAAVRPNAAWKRACFMYAEKGNNGKGTLCSLMRNLVGKRSCTSISLSDFSKDFRLEPLTHASAVIVDENDVGTYIDKAADLKATITGDPIQINMKYKTPISFRPKVFMVQCLNEMPKVKDKSDSFYRRQLFIPFTKCFTGMERKYIKDDYLNRKEVLEYVLYSVLNMNYYEFDEPEKCKNALAEYKEFNDPMRQFVSDTLPEMTWNEVPNEFYYDLYKAWYKKNVSESLKGITSGRVFRKDLVLISNYIEELGFRMENKASRIKFDKPEYLIYDYKLEDWYNPNYKGNDVNKICMPEGSKNGKKYNFKLVRIM